MARPALLAGVALLTCSCFSFKVEPQAATPQRPTVSSDTSTTAPGTFELEAGGLIDPHDGWDSPLTLKWGMSGDAELFAGWSPYQEEQLPGPDASGVGDTLVGLRYRFLEEAGSRPAAALQLATKLPTGDEHDGLSTGEVDFLAAGILSKQVGQVGTTLFYQLGVLGEPDGTGTDIEHSIALAGSFPLAEGWALLGELAAVEVPEQDLNAVFTTAGFAYTVSKDLVLDVAVVVGLNDDAPDFQVVFGFTKNLGGPGLAR
jgi:Putative MetA-pathway of phenol degradation